MTPELERYYEERLALFATRGWKDLMEDVQTMRSATNTIIGLTDETLRIKQGELSIMDWMLALEETSKRAYADLQLPLSEGAPYGTDQALSAQDG